MKNLKTELWAVAVVLLALVLPSCSDGASDLLGGVPAETKGVMVIKPADLAQKSDIKGFLKKMGFRGKDKKTFDAVMELFEEGGIGLDCMVAFEYEEGGYLSFVINDKKKFAEAELIGENTDKNKQDGFVYYEVNGTEGRTNIIVDGRKAWLAFGDTDVDGQIEAVKKFQGLGKDKSVLSIPHFSENMQDGDMNVFLNIEEIVGFTRFKGQEQEDG